MTSTPLRPAVNGVPRPLVKRPNGTRYNTVLSVDGGGVRGIIPTMLLIRMEEQIKEHLFENRDTLIPEPINNSVVTVDDFDVDLTDYFDLVAGTSIGSVLATYVAARGKGSDAIVNDEAIRETYGQLRPGSMEAMRVVFREYGREVFPRRSFLSNVTRLFRPLYPTDGLQNVLARSFGDTTMSDLETGLLVTAYDLRRNAACSFLRGAGADAPLYTVRTATRDHPRHSPSDGAGHAAPDGTSGPSSLAWVPDIDIIEGTNYRLGDITLGSSSAPTYFAPVDISPLSEGEELRLIDGGVVANNPTLQALTYAPSCFSADSIDNVAILSLGCGNTDPSGSNRENPGVGWWLLSGNLIDSLQNGTAEYIQAVTDYWLYRNVGVPYGQYTRIQKIADDPETERILASLDGVEFLPDLQGLGEDLARENEVALRTFVRDFLFAV